MKKWNLMLILLFAFYGHAEASQLETNFLKKKDNLIETLLMAQIENARDLFSDPRLKLYPEIFERSTIKTGWEVVFTQESIDRGKQCLRENDLRLRKVEIQYGVPKEILIGIYRVETNLGKNTGKYVVFNSLLTWCVSGDSRARWAERELTAYLMLCSENQLDPFEIKGSSHGAFGLVQFIPSTFRKFALDGNGDGKIDLFNFEDAIVSSAHYLRKNGWGKRERQKKWALYAYNHDWGYVKAILKYSKLIKIQQ